jgi:hypothetical protein
MNEIPPRFGQPLDLPRKERDPEAEKIHTEKEASAVALEQIKRHIDDGKAVVVDFNEPANSTIVDGPRLEKGKEKEGGQPVTFYFVAVYGYEIDANGKIVGGHFVKFVTVPWL